MIPLDKETFEAYMERLLEQVERVVGTLDKKNKKPQNYLNGERLYDNQDVCLLLNISKQTLQRYRDNGLKYHTILHKTYYREGLARVYTEVFRWRECRERQNEGM